MLTKKQKEYAINAVKHMKCEDKNPERLKNFVVLNYGKIISIATAKRYWEGK